MVQCLVSMGLIDPFSCHWDAMIRSIRQIRPEQWFDAAVWISKWQVQYSVLCSFELWAQRKSQSVKLMTSNSDSLPDIFPLCSKMALSQKTRAIWKDDRSFLWNIQTEVCYLSYSIPLDHIHYFWFCEFVAKGRTRAIVLDGVLSANRTRPSVHG